MTTSKFTYTHFDPPYESFFCAVLTYRMTSVGPENENEDPEVDVNAMVAEVGAESVATVQAPTRRTRGQLRAAIIARQNASGEQPNSPVLQQLSGVSDMGMIVCLRLTLTVPLLVRRHAPTV